MKKFLLASSLATIFLCAMPDVHAAAPAKKAAEPSSDAALHKLAVINAVTTQLHKEHGFNMEAIAKDKVYLALDESSQKIVMGKIKAAMAARTAD